MNENFTDNVAAQRFEMSFGEAKVWADYRREDKTLVIRHVEADLSLRGSGAAGRFMQQLAQAARAQGAKIHPRCSYAAAWLKRHDPTLVT